MNAFMNLSSSFLREAILWDCLRETELKDPGWIEITSIKYGNEEIKGNLLFITPDDGNKDDRTLALINLPSPVLPGQTASLEIKFSTKLPQIVMGIGYIENFFLFSHWYPKLCSIEEKEGRFGWDYHQFHFPSLVNSNFANYRVEINIPRNFRIGATGNKIFEKKIGKRKITRFYAENVNDFVWVASSSFLEYKDNFVYGKDAPVNFLKEKEKLANSEDLREKIEISLLIRPERKVYKERYFKVIKEFLRNYLLTLSKYSYSSITFVDFPVINEKTEFLAPNMIIGNHPFFSPENSLHLEKIVSRSLGEQYWRNIVASNGADEPWLGNGLVSYSEYLSLKESLDESVIYKYLSFIPIPYMELPNLPLFGFYFIKTRETIETSLLLDYLKKVQFDPILKKTYKFGSFNSYKINTKIKPALILLTLERNFGKNKVNSFLRKYFIKYAFGKPNTQNFLDMIGAEIGIDARRLFEHFLLKTDFTDFRVVEVKNDKIKEKNGSLFLSSVLIEKKGELVFPVYVEIFFADGNKVMEKWDGEGNWKRFVYKGTKKIEKVVIDPHEKFLLDEDRFNNSFLLKRRKIPFVKALTFWHVLIEKFLHDLSFFI